MPHPKPVGAEEVDEGAVEDEVARPGRVVVEEDRTFKEGQEATVEGEWEAPMAVVQDMARGSQKTMEVVEVVQVQGLGGVVSVLVLPMVAISEVDMVMATKITIR